MQLPPRSRTDQSARHRVLRSGSRRRGRSPSAPEVARRRRRAAGAVDALRAALPRLRRGPRDREWDPACSGCGARSSVASSSELRAACRPRRWRPCRRTATCSAVCALVEADDGPSVAAFLQRDASREQVLRLPARAQHPAAQGVRPAVVRAGADRRAAKVALAELPVRRVRRRPTRPTPRHGSTPMPSRQPVSTARLRRLHRRGVGPLSGDGQRDVALRPEPAPAGSGDGPPRGLRGDQLGPLAQDRRRGGAGRAASETVAAYFLEHVEADAVHEQVAVRDICAFPGRRGPVPARRRALRSVDLPAPGGALRRTELLDRWAPSWRWRHERGGQRAGVSRWPLARARRRHRRRRGGVGSTR